SGLGQRRAQRRRRPVGERSASEQRLRCRDDLLGLRLAVDERGEVAGERALRLACAGPRRGSLVELRELLMTAATEVPQVDRDGAVGGVAPELVERVRAGEFRIEPDGAARALAERRSVRLGDQRRSERVDGTLALAADEVHPSGDVAPLIGATELECAPEAAVKFGGVVRLGELGRELGEADAALQASLHALGREHSICRKVVAYLTEESEWWEVRRPAW